MNTLTWGTCRMLIVRPAVVLVTVLVFVFAMSVPASAFQASCISSAKYGLTCSLGLELWEEGRRSDKIFQQWHLSCDSNPGSCILERKLIVIWPENSGGTQVSTHHHSTTDGTLRLLHSEWNEGTLELDVVYPDGNRLPVRMKLKEVSTGILDVESFQAKSIVRPIFGGGPVSQDWRVPDYSYNVKVEMRIEGKKSSDAKGYDEIIKRLTVQDRAAFDQSKAKCFDDALNEKYLSQLPGLSKTQESYEARLRDIATKISQAKDIDEKTRLFDQQRRLEDEAFKEIYSTDVKNQTMNRFEKCLHEAGMSLDGRRAITQALLKSVWDKIR